MDGATVGLVGSIACLVVVCSLGGILGTYISIKSAKGPRERVFIRRWAAICWITVMCYCGLLFFSLNRNGKDWAGERNRDSEIAPTKGRGIAIRRSLLQSGN